MLAWFAALFGVAWARWPVEISTLAPVCCLAVAAAIVALPSYGLSGSRAVVILPAVAFLLLKSSMGQPLLGQAAASTVAELSLIGASVFLARAVALCVAEFEQSVVHSMVEPPPDSYVPSQVGEPAMYREVRRARHYERPLSMLSVSVGPGQLDLSLDRLFERVQREGIQKYLESQLIHLLAEETRDSDLITQRGGSIFALLTETEESNAQLLGNRVSAIASDRLGLEIRVGVSSFPKQCLTLDRLFSEAETQSTSAAEDLAVPGSTDGEAQVLAVGEPEVTVRRADSA